jgi:hypothetical protein
MIYIKKFIDKVSIVESKHGKDIVMPMIEARGLRDELAKVLTDLHMLNTNKSKEEPIIKVEMKGGSW